jgi:hypothetical protein
MMRPVPRPAVRPFGSILPLPRCERFSRRIESAASSQRLIL